MFWSSQWIKRRILAHGLRCNTVSDRKRALVKPLQRIKLRTIRRHRNAEPKRKERYLNEESAPKETIITGVTSKRLHNGLHVCTNATNGVTSYASGIELQAIILIAGLRPCKSHERFNSSKISLSVALLSYLE